MGQLNCALTPPKIIILSNGNWNYHIIKLNSKLSYYQIDQYCLLYQSGESSAIAFHLPANCISLKNLRFFGIFSTHFDCRKIPSWDHKTSSKNLTLLTFHHDGVEWSLQLTLRATRQYRSCSSIQDLLISKAMFNATQRTRHSSGERERAGERTLRHLQLHRLRQRRLRRRHLAHWQSVVDKYWPRASQVSAIQTMDKQTKRDTPRRRCCLDKKTRRWRRKGRNRNRYKPADKHLQEPRTENMLQFPSLGCAECVRSTTDVAADAVIERVRVRVGIGIGVQKSWPRCLGTA